VGARWRIRFCGREADNGQISHCGRGRGGRSPDVWIWLGLTSGEMRWLLVFQNEDKSVRGGRGSRNWRRETGEASSTGFPDWGFIDEKFSLVCHPFTVYFSREKKRLTLKLLNY
jgi:hypothetical protein